MGYALKMASVDFSDAAVGQVTFIETVPCTALSLDQSTLSFEKAGETKTLTATKTPADTTDALVWSSSDTNVATVENGVVTIHGIGNVTITATCGSQTATAAIAQTSLKAQYTYAAVSGKSCGSGNSGIDDKKYLVITSISSQSIGGQAYTGTDDLRIRSGDNNNIECIRVPYGATKVRVSISSGSVSYIEVVDTNSILTIDGVDYPEWIKNKDFPFANGYYSVEYGQAFAFRGPTAGIEAVEYVYFE